MADFPKDQVRLRIADDFLRFARRDSEADMRSGISRIYYAAFHLATMLTAKNGHAEVRKALEQVDDNLASEFSRLQKLRAGADYDPAFVEREFGSIHKMRARYPEELERATSLYEELLASVGGV